MKKLSPLLPQVKQQAKFSLLESSVVAKEESLLLHTEWQDGTKEG